MPDKVETLRKDEIIRGRSAFKRLLREGARVRGNGVTLFFYPPANKGLVV